MQDRHIPLLGASNMRDLGGVPLSEGHPIRRGLVFRSASLSGLTAADHGQLRALNLTTIVDLRSRSEQRDQPSRLPAGLTVIAPGDGGIGAQPGITRNRRPHTEDEAITMMRQGYESYPDRMATAIAALFEAIAQAPKAPVLFHCTAGKDRTGFVAAVLLKALGADDADIMADYLATNELWDRKSARMSFLPKPAQEAIFQARAEYLHAALDTVTNRFGSVEDYLLSACTVSSKTIDSARDVLVG